MKKLLSILFLLVPFIINAQTYVYQDSVIGSTSGTGAHASAADRVNFASYIVITSDYAISRVGMTFHKQGSPTMNFTGTIYDNDTGNSNPNNILGTSPDSVDATTLTGSLVWHYFDFDPIIGVSTGDTIWIGPSSDGYDGSNYVQIGRWTDLTGLVRKSSDQSSWAAYITTPLSMRIYSDLNKTYHVDPVSGNDDNNGLSPSTALASFDSINTAGVTLVADDSIGTRTGTTVRGQLTIPRDSVYVMPYDSATGLTGAAALALGDTAVISGSNLVSTWTTATILGPELVVDGDFETTGNNGWNQNSSPVEWAKSDVEAHAGTYSRYVIGNSTNDGVYQTNVVTVVDTIYTMSAWVYNVGFTADCTQVSARTTGFVDIETAFVTSTGSWEEVEFDFTASGTVTHAVIRQIGAGADTFYVDDVSIRKKTIPNIWKATQMTEPTAHVFFDGTIGGNESDSGDLDTDKEWSWSSDVLYQYSASDPDTRYTTPGTEQSIRSNAILGSDATDYIDITGIVVKHAAADGLNTSSGDNWNITNVTAIQNYRYGIRAGINSDAILIDGCVGSTDNLTGIGSHTASNLTVQNSTTQNNNYRANADGMQFNNTSVLIVDGNLSSGNDQGSSSDGIQLQKCPNAVVKYNYTHDNGNSGIILSGADGTYSYGEVSYNLIDEPTANHAIALAYIGDGNTVVYNNTLYAGQLRIAVIEDPHTLTVKNNIFVGTSGKVVDEATAVDDALITMDYNLFYNTSGTMITWEGNNYTQAQFASYQSTEEQDANSISADPLFTDAASDDFTLQSGSPAIDAGTDVGLTQDYLGNGLFGSAWDIGAYEYQISAGYQKRYKKFTDYWRYRRY